MGRVLGQNVVLRGEAGKINVFLAGEELPDEYADRVGEHVYAGYKKPEKEEKAPKKVSVSEPGNPAVNPSPEQVEEKMELPSGNASKAEWMAFASRYGVEVPADAGRDDIRDLVHAKFPELQK